MGDEGKQVVSSHACKRIFCHQRYSTQAVYSQIGSFLPHNLELIVHDHFPYCSWVLMGVCHGVHMSIQTFGRKWKIKREESVTGGLQSTHTSHHFLQHSPTFHNSTMYIIVMNPSMDWIIYSFRLKLLLFGSWYALTNPKVCFAIPGKFQFYQVNSKD